MLMVSYGLIVGNVPYNMGEEQLIDVFKSVGQVIGFRYGRIRVMAGAAFHRYCRLVFDRETGKPKGYGFCEFAGTIISVVWLFLF